MSGTPNRAAGLEKRLAEPGISVIPYLTGGFPTMTRFAELLPALATVAAAVEIGIPFSDPMADGTTIQESSRVALEGGATLESILHTVEEVGSLQAELMVMSYLNPLLAFGLDALMGRLTAVGVGAVVVPDLPFEESGPLSAALSEAGIGLVQLVTPVTAPERVALLGSVSQGFTYAVTMTGTTGGRLNSRLGVAEYLDAVRAVSRAPVVAGFGVRDAEQVEALAPHCDGVIVGSALVEVVSSGADPVGFLEGLRP
jgi:tryptophan synthase alpha chain